MVGVGEVDVAAEDGDEILGPRQQIAGGEGAFIVLVDAPFFAARSGPACGGHDDGVLPDSAYIRHQSGDGDGDVDKE